MAIDSEMLAEFRIVHVVGPRQSGKTTLARSVASELGMRYLTLDDPAVRAAAVTDPHGFYPINRPCIRGVGRVPGCARADPGDQGVIGQRPERSTYGISLSPCLCFFWH